MKKNIITIITITSATLMLTSCNLGSSDGTVENWFAAIILLLAWLKGGR